MSGGAAGVDPPERPGAPPYPPRDAADERHRLVPTWLDALPMINHYCFAGRQSFRDGFRALVAGCETGDATIFLAEQLRGTDAQIVHLDLDASSAGIARERARVRGLPGVRFVEASLAELPGRGLGAFDYVSCGGAFGSADDPDAALDALIAVLKPTGALGVSLNATHGRVGVTALRSLLRLLADPSDAPDERLTVARQVLATLPPTNWFKRTESLYRNELAFGEAGIDDLLLHARERTWTIGDVYDLLVDRRGLRIDPTCPERGRSAYEPAYTLGPEHAALIEEIGELGPRRRHEVAELLSGAITVHTFYATRSASCRAPYGDADYVPFFFHEPVSGPEIAALVARHDDRPFVLAHARTGVRVVADPGRHGRRILDKIDGRRTFGEIFGAVRAELADESDSPSDAELFDDFRPLHDVLASIDRMLLRHRDAERK